MATATNLRIDNQILVIDKIISRHIDNLDALTRGTASQDILSQLRTFVEHIMLKIYANGQDIENTYDPNIRKAVNSVKKRGELKFLWKFHKSLQITTSHYALDEENSERLMLKYYEYLLRIKDFLKTNYSLNVLCNLDKFPLLQYGYECIDN